MAQFYSDPSRERETYSLPNFEVFYLSADEILSAWRANNNTWMADTLEDRVNENAPAEDDCEPADVCTHLLSTGMGEVRACGVNDGPVDSDINFCTCYACNREHEAHQQAQDLAGWYYWPCFPGYLPDGEAAGPFESVAEAIQDARDNYDGQEW